MKGILHILTGIFLISASACTPVGEGAEPRDSSTQGDVSVSVDATLRPLFEAELSAFLEQNEKAKIRAEFLPESKVVEAFINQKSRAMTLTRELTKEELAPLEAKGLKVRYSLVAMDGIALISGTSNPLTQLSREEIGKVLRGEIRFWSELGWEQNQDSIVLVADQSGSSLVRQLNKEFSVREDQLRLFGAGEGEAVIRYVIENPAALGFVGLSYLSDLDDTNAVKFRADLNIFALEAADSAPEPDYYHRPWAGSIREGNYLLVREVYMATWEPYIGLGTGFVHFVAGEKGQRIVAKAGMAPGRPPVRIIQLPPSENATDIHDYIKQERKKKND